MKVFARLMVAVGLLTWVSPCATCAPTKNKKKPQRNDIAETYALAPLIPSVARLHKKTVVVEDKIKISETADDKDKALDEAVLEDASVQPSWPSEGRSRR